MKKRRRWPSVPAQGKIVLLDDGVRPTVALCAFAIGLFSAETARADVTSWLAVGSGYSLQTQAKRDQVDRAVALSYSLGVGSSPRDPVVVGGIFRAVTHLTLGTDIGLAVRAASGGFARGQWGVALDAGVVGRYWGTTAYGSYPLQGVLTFGAPWGVQLGIGGEVWSVSQQETARGVFAVLELDLLRFTVMRQGPATDSVWRNPNPAGGTSPY